MVVPSLWLGLGDARDSGQVSVTDRYLGGVADPELPLPDPELPLPDPELPLPDPELPLPCEEPDPELPLP
jgi:hypothetical protein